MRLKDIVMRTGRALSAMIMPNIGAFIAWGLITALFIPSGWWPNENLAKMVAPALNYLLPILIAYTAGKNIAGDRGGVTGAIATIGVIAGTDIPMFIGAMIMGPLGGLAIKKFDKFTQERIRSGFEMLVNNFSIGIIGMLLAILGFCVIGNAVEGLTSVLNKAAQAVISHKLLPLISIVVEPAKVLFLNNAINHGIFSPIGIEQVHEFGQSIMFLIEANPGAGFGILLAYWIAGRGNSKSSAPGAAVIHFLGGIHEIYFPYVLAKPLLLVALIAGSAASLLFFSIFKVGLVAPASPGSIIAILAMAPKGETFLVLCGVLIATIVSLIIAIPIIRHSGKEDIPAEVNSGKVSLGEGNNSEDNNNGNDSDGIASNPNRREGPLKILFACDAGMGSSALGATKFRKRAEQAGSDAQINNCAIDSIPGDTDIVVCQRTLQSRAEQRVQANVASGGKSATVICIDNFISDPNLDKLIEAIVGRRAADNSIATTTADFRKDSPETIDSQGSAVDISKPEVTDTTPVEITVTDKNDIGTVKSESPKTIPVLTIDNILTGLAPENKEDAILRAGRLLESRGYAGKGYAEAMLERERITTTYLGMGIAIPHGTDEAKENILTSGVVFLQYPDGVDFGEEKAYIIVGIAGKGDDHIDILASLSEAFEDEDKLHALMTAKDPKEIFNILTNNNFQ